MFDYVTKKLFGKDIKIISGACNRLGVNSCCDGGGTSNCCKSMFLHINNYCNANCSFCFEEKGSREIKNFSKLRKSISELVSNNIVSKVVLTGGEPLMHPKIRNFFNILDEFDLKYYSLNTNGILLHNFVDMINSSRLKHINISMAHHDDDINKEIMGNCLSFKDIEILRGIISKDIYIRLACTITERISKTEDIMIYINRAKSIGIDYVIFRNEYIGLDKNLDAFRGIWGHQYHADICTCSQKIINGVDSEYRESNIKLKQDICDKDLYFRDFIYKDDDILSGSWEYGSQEIF